MYRLLGESMLCQVTSSERETQAPWKQAERKKGMDGTTGKGLDPKMPLHLIKSLKFFPIWQWSFNLRTDTDKTEL